MSRSGHRRARTALAAVVAALGVASTGSARPFAQAVAPDLKAERALAATVSETRMVEAVRTLVGFGTRMYGTPSNHESAAWLAGAFKEAGLDVTVRKDTPRDWYQASAWDVRMAGAGGAVSEDDVAQLGVALRQG